ncbi:MAG: hypothetical protein RR821_01340 [Clostridia bacterium]
MILWIAAFLPSAALADDAGVLSEGELNAWISQVLRDSAKEQPMNAPVGESALTEDGYAFLYPFATLYYDKPVLDEKSILQGISITDEHYAALRGVALGSGAEALFASYGWQNPNLMGDGSFASFYRLNELPRAAYWSWAQHEGEILKSVQCAIHVKAGEDQYTDAGLLYTLENGVVTGIRVYGLNKCITQADVRKNLDAVMSVEAMGSGDEPSQADSHAQQVVKGYEQKHEQPVFSQADLKLNPLDYTTLTEKEAQAVLGDALQQDSVKDDTGATLLTVKRKGVTLSYTLSADGTDTSVEAMVIDQNVLAGPRGIRIGDSLEKVLALFASDGEGRVQGTSAVLYGDGVNAPTGLYETVDAHTATLRYTTLTAQETTVTLHMTFADTKLTEMMIYSW